jgi:hypothetical protein
MLTEGDTSSRQTWYRTAPAASGYNTGTQLSNSTVCIRTFCHGTLPASVVLIIMCSTTAEVTVPGTTIRGAYGQRNIMNLATCQTELLHGLSSALMALSMA